MLPGPIGQRLAVPRLTRPPVEEVLLDVQEVVAHREAVPGARIAAAPVQVHVLAAAARLTVVVDGPGRPIVAAGRQVRCVAVPDAAEVATVPTVVEADGS